MLPINSTDDAMEILGATHRGAIGPCSFLRRQVDAIGAPVSPVQLQPYYTSRRDEDGTIAIYEAGWAVEWRREFDYAQEQLRIWVLMDGRHEVRCPNWVPFRPTVDNIRLALTEAK